MSVALLDVNVLLAMLWPRHVFFHAARQWFAANRSDGWATCPITQSGFVRLFSQPAITGIEINPQEAMELLEKNCNEPGHVLWAQDYPMSGIRPEILQRIFGHQHVTDALLLDLAIRNHGRLATLDRRIARLLPSDSPHLAAIEVISTT